MEGSKLKARLIKMGETPATVARKLKISPQSLNQIFKAADIKSGFIEKLANAYSKPIAYFFEEQLIIENQSRHDDHSARYGSKTEHYENSGDEQLRLKLKISESEIISLKEQLKGKEETILALKANIETQKNIIEYLNNTKK